MRKIIESAMKDAEVLVSGGVDGLQIENQWDHPYAREKDVGPETVASMAAVTAVLRERFDTPFGVCIHLNAVIPAIAVAAATGCRWVRAFELANAYVSNAGIIEASGPAAMRYRSALRFEEDVKVFADFHVKHGSHHLIEDRSIEDQLEDVQTAGADAAIVTGTKTGVAPGIEEIVRLQRAVSVPLIIGSGLSAENALDLMPLLDGAIVGSYFKVDGKLENPVDVSRVRNLMAKIRVIRES